MFYRYRFESEIYPDLSRIPLHVRLKLDLTGVKISLNDWLAYSMEERAALCHLPVETEDEKKTFASYLDFLSRRYHGQQAKLTKPIVDPPWENPVRIPDSVSAKSKDIGKPVTTDEWNGWNVYQRYAVYKLSISKNEPEKFEQALQEFRARQGGQSP